MKVFLVALFSLALVGCASAQKKQHSATASSFHKKKKIELEQIPLKSVKGPDLDLSSRKYKVREFDINGDKIPDMISVYKRVRNKETKERELQLFVKEMDLNHDRKIDVYRFFDDKGMVVKEELDLDFDGKIDSVDYYQGGVVRRREVSMQFSDRPTVIKVYDENGVLARLETDYNQDGRVDYWEYYNKGVLQRIERDTDGDGKADIFKRAGDKTFTVIKSANEEFDYQSPIKQTLVNSKGKKEDTPSKSEKKKSEKQ